MIPRMNPICLLIGLMLLMSSAFAADRIDQRLAHADEIKRAQRAEFARELDALVADAAQMTQPQREYLEYLRGWQSTFDGAYDVAITRFQALVEQAQDPLVRFRSRATLLNALTLSRRYAAGFEQLNAVLRELGSIENADARAQALGVSAQMLNQVAQYAESLRYSTLLMEESSLPWARCGAAQLEFESRFKSGELTDVTPALGRWAEECALRGELIFSGLLRTYEARLNLKNGRFAEAISLLSQQKEAYAAARYPFLISEVAAIQAMAHLAMGDLAKADQFAQETIDATASKVYTEALTEAWKVKYQVAVKREDMTAALPALETYREVDRAYLDEVGQRALAFELARHEARAKSLQIESLNRRNQVLELEQQVAAKDVQTARLSILLLLTVLASAIFWALRTRRMKRHFQNLAQNDSLTSISSRPYFMDRAVARLEQLQRDDQHAALIVIDLDYFKNVNDQYGHAVGDDVLQRAAFACGILLEPSDLFGRLGGEEFAILTVVPLDRAMALAERCRLALHEISFGPEDKPSTLSGSFGVASSEYSGYDLRSLLVQADAALYEAKRKGRNRVISQAPRRDASMPFRAIA